MAKYTFKNGIWYDKATGLPSEPSNKGHTWVPGSTFHIMPDIAGYDCPVSGKWIGSRREHAENLKRRGCRVLEKGEKAESIKTRERELSASIDRQVSEAVRHVAREF